MKNILIYFDEGVDLSSYKHLAAACHQHLSARYRIFAVNHRFFITSGWEEKTALVIFPGGRDLLYQRHLQGEGNLRLRSYVKNGGRYFGVCAGGYYGSSSIEFEKGNDLEICAPRELGFFPGKAVGPAFGKGKFSYDSEMGAQDVQVQWKQGISKIYLNGGCFFENAENYSTIEILARYPELPEAPAAAIYSSFGLGKALLIGVHPEYSRDELFICFLFNKILT